ncbi:putative selenate ABC transporter substrate-binding protein [Desulfogranum mediterraneum]|uniref:putative selenate ABC transporter substrate-binding protein n=1 Tax=Desulfogranum mediterraneum TaxID=160661 RepID=UPI0003F65FD3|nr:putative selenate ABC transporter substrate-binding protein [Desulfogranum mediterraneum]
MRPKTVVNTLIALSALLWLGDVAWGQELRFTAIPDQDTARLEQRFTRIADYLSQEVGIPFSYVPVKSYGASVQAFKNNQVQLAWFGGLSGVQARMAVQGSQAIAQGEEDQHFVSYIIAHHSTGLQPAETLPEAMRGMSFTFGAKGSTSGRLMPEYYLRLHFTQAPEKIFQTVGFSGDHSKTIALVQSGSYQLGAVNFKVWEKELTRGTIDPGKVQVIWKTPEYPDYNWSIRGDLDQQFGQGTAAKIRQALLSLDDPALLDTFPRRRFIPADNSLYLPILETGKAIGIFR